MDNSLLNFIASALYAGVFFLVAALATPNFVSVLILAAVALAWISAYSGYVAEATSNGAIAGLSVGSMVCALIFALWAFVIFVIRTGGG